MTAMLGLAHHLPARRAVGATERPIAVDRGGPSDLARPAAARALGEAGLAAADLDLVIFATMTPDVTFPGAACYLQDKLGCGTSAALDVRGQCAGFLTGLLIADAYLAAGLYRHILLAAAEVHSAGLDYSGAGRDVAELYGDGAAVAVLGEGGAGIEAILCRSDGRHHERYWIEYPSSRRHPLRITLDDLRTGRHYPRLDRAHLTSFAEAQLPAIVHAALARAERTLGEIDAFLFSHVLPGVAGRCAAIAGVPAERLIDAGAAHGHLSAATLPLALSEALASERLGRGARVCLAACGAGYAWGAAVLRL